MVWIPGGEFSMGAQSPPDMDDVGMKATLDSRPIHRVYVDGFFMDKTDVTNAEFEKFVKATGYVTASASRARRTTQGPRRKIWLLVQWSLLRPIIQCHSITTSNGGPTCPERTGVIRWVQTATLLAGAIILWCTLHMKTPLPLRNGRANSSRLKQSGSLPHSLGPDSGANEKVYGKKISGQQIFAGSVRAPPQAAELLSTLQEKSPSNASRGKS